MVKTPPRVLLTLAGAIRPEFMVVVAIVRATTSPPCGNSEHGRVASIQYGHIGIESHDASLSQAHLLYQIQDGVNRIISPAPYALSRYRPQPWLRPALAA